jgi:myosin heavy subunit
MAAEVPKIETTPTLSTAESVRETKKAISELIREITEYKDAQEEEKSELEAQLIENDEELEKQSDLSSVLETSITQLQEERQSLIEQIEALEQRHELALEEESKRKNSMRVETLENLQTLMDELKRIEEANELLREQHEKGKQQIQEERAAHSATLEELIKEKELMEEHKAKIEALRLKNEALITQLKQLKSAQQLKGDNNATTASMSTAAISAAPSLGTATSLGTGTAIPATATMPSTTSLPSTAVMDTNNSSGSITEPKTSKQTELYHMVRKLQPQHSAAIMCSIIVGGQMWIGTADGNITIWEIEVLTTIVHMLLLTRVCRQDRCSKSASTTPHPSPASS